MITEQQATSIIENKVTVVGTDGDKIGNVGTLYFDDETGRPDWVTVKTGLFGSSETFVPLEGASLSGDTLTVRHTKEAVKDAPRMDADQHLDLDQEAELYRYYGLDYGAGTGTTGTTGTAGTTGTSGTTDRDSHVADDTLVRSEERVDVGTRRREAGKVRLRKYVVTENVTKTVPVTREEVRVEREPITGADRGRGGAEIGEDVAEVTLHEDEVVTDKETVPVEKVRLDTDTVSEDAQVTEEVRKEQIATETDRDTRH
ncbi:PRC and DUF2382 domain-containing protein [Georgenia satyanarayanai]|uniref:DUF2382 domain-containing protein n=1 Tax=Georgenia satyanarayanai TaxID=860221 RepID=UPI00203A9051|nr:PRC and DUF2382 domain-containing protein [Georgenia satyanarayanai]MCM3660914.1 PRC and DUF2382 domain-containing protein [Georgenia satyanarayanai]